MSDVPPVELGPARVGDVGSFLTLVIQERDLNGVLIPVDLTGTSSTVITLERPDGTTVVKDAITLDPPVAGQMRVTIEAGDLNQVGRYPIQGQVAWTGPDGGVWFTSEAVLIVDRSL